MKSNILFSFDCRVLSLLISEHELLDLFCTTRLYILSTRLCQRNFISRAKGDSTFECVQMSAIAFVCVAILRVLVSMATIDCLDLIFLFVVGEILGCCESCSCIDLLNTDHAIIFLPSKMRSILYVRLQI